MNDIERQEQMLEFMKVKGRPIVTIEMMDWLIANGFFVKPAAIKHHGNYTGGLFDHSLAVAKVLVEMTEKFDIPWSRPESPYIVGMFHDVCKMDDYIDENASNIVVMGTGSPVSKSPKWTYNDNKIFDGHGDKSVMMLSQVMTLTVEEMLCIRFHMGAYVTGDWNYFDKAIRNYQSVLFTHTADMYVSKVQDV